MLYSMVMLTRRSQGEELRSSWPTIRFALLYCERDAGAFLTFKAVSIGVWEARTMDSEYRITMLEPIQERDLVTATALFQGRS